jgi:hypothetical protein
MNRDTYMANVLDETGAIRPLSQLLESEHNANFAARSAQILAEREAASKKSKTEKLVEDTQRMYDDARHNNDRAKLPFWKNQLEQAKEKLAGEREAEQRAKLFGKDERIALIRQEADLIQRSGAHLLPHASQLERDELVATARSDSYPDPESQFRSFKELSDRLTNAEIEAERIKASDAEIEANRQHMTAAESNVRTAQLEQLRARREGVASE